MLPYLYAFRIELQSHRPWSFPLRMLRIGRSRILLNALCMLFASLALGMLGARQSYFRDQHFKRR